MAQAPPHKAAVTRLPASVLVAMSVAHELRRRWQAQRSPSRLNLASCVRQKSRRPVGPVNLFDQQQPALLVAVEGIDGREQTRALDEPWLIVCTDVKDEHQVFGF